MSKRISEPSIIRLCLICRLLEESENDGIKTIYSSVIGEQIGASALSVRKDLSILDDMGNNLAGYNVVSLKNRIIAFLGLDKKWNTCVVGLGRLGLSLLHYEQIAASAFHIVAGFDNDINRLELIKSTVELFPAYMIEEVVQNKNIELAILAVPKNAAQNTADRLIACGINGIVNFAPVVLKTQKQGVFIRNMDLVTEMRILSALSSLRMGGEAHGIS